MFFIKSLPGLVLLLGCYFQALAPVTTPPQSMSLLFFGDVMGHGPQIRGAYDPSQCQYDFNHVFEPVCELLSKPDFTIGNLEVTLAGEPYGGYPKFSSPDQLAVACKNNGVDVLVTANNHSCDRGKEGIVRTLNVLDSLQIAHTGTFRDSLEREQHNLVLLSKDDIRVGLLNYTYGTNALPAPPPTRVNLIDTSQIKLDIEKSFCQKLDRLLVMIHWGVEYESIPDSTQRDLAQFLFDHGADIIIGSHPHVVQPMVFQNRSRLHRDRLLVYSLGNFVSNQRTRGRDGGAMIELEIVKWGDQTSISSPGYHLVWVNRFREGGRLNFEVIPGVTVQQQDLNEPARAKLDTFLLDAKRLLSKENILVNEVLVPH